MMKILLVEDDPAVNASVARRLKFEGFQVESAVDGYQALEAFEHHQPQLVVLDVMLPGIDGFAVAGKIRETSETPILMLTARDHVSDRVRGLERGADDYLVKPFAIEELLARIRALLRRSKTQNESSESEAHFGVRIDPKTHEAFRDDERLTLTLREFELLSYFVLHPRQALRREQILEAVWGFEESTSSNVVDVYVRQLREKLEENNRSRLIQTVRGVGYAFRED